MTARTHSCTPATPSAGEALIESTWMDGWLLSSHRVRNTRVLEILQNCRHRKPDVPDVFFADFFLPTLRRVAAKCCGWAQVFKSLLREPLHRTWQRCRDDKISGNCCRVPVLPINCQTILLREHDDTVLGTAVVFCCKASRQAWRPDSNICQCKKKLHIKSPTKSFELSFLL